MRPPQRLPAQPRLPDKVKTSSICRIRDHSLRLHEVVTSRRTCSQAVDRLHEVHLESTNAPHEVRHVLDLAPGWPKTRTLSSGGSDGCLKYTAFLSSFLTPELPFVTASSSPPGLVLRCCFSTFLKVARLQSPCLPPLLAMMPLLPLLSFVLLHTPDASPGQAPLSFLASLSLVLLHTPVASPWQAPLRWAYVCILTTRPGSRLGAWSFFVRCAYRTLDSVRALRVALGDTVDR